MTIDHIACSVWDSERKTVALKSGLQFPPSQAFEPCSSKEARMGKKRVPACIIVLVRLSALRETGGRFGKAVFQQVMAIWVCVNIGVPCAKASE